MNKESHEFIWKFHRIGGLDQVMLRTAAELTNLRELDPKVWVALSCPTTGIECDHRTLQLIDANNDGRIRVPEVLGAVEWLCARLKNPEDMIDSPESLLLDQINDDTEEGKRLLSSARAVLNNIGKPDAQDIAPDDITQALKVAGQFDFNGDGILPPLPSFDNDVNQFIQDALDTMGGLLDASGTPGINRAIADALVTTLQKRQVWKQTVGNALTPLGDATDTAWNQLQSLKAKIDDYFLRCDFAAFAPNVAFASKHHTPQTCKADEDKLRELLDETIVPHPACTPDGLLEVNALADLPLARIEADRPLCLSSGLNPAWRSHMERFASIMAPLLPTPDTMTRDDWKNLQAVFADYEAALADKPGPVDVDVLIPPVKSLEQIPDENINAILSGDIAERFHKLMDEDENAPSVSGDIADLERLILYHCHLHRLLMNFVSFLDFYSLHRKAAFQAGTLFMDGRTCKLCLPVIDVDKHAALASHSHLCLLYCECSRAGEGDPQTKKIVAAMTAGGADSLNAGRNGVFVDDNGDDWDATIVKIVSNPISIKQAIWDPYRRFGKMMSEQINKFAASKQAQATEKLQQIGSSATAAVMPGKAPAAGFDIGKSVGIFAAIGLALGAIGTAAATILSALFSLAWWQFPLLFLSIFLIISGPSVLLAWLKLRKRTLGPLLEASGWAVNGRIPINFFLGGELTSEATLPPNATRSYNDPLYKKPSRWPHIVTAIVLVCLLLFGGWFWAKKHNALPKWFKEAATTVEKAIQPPAK